MTDWIFHGLTPGRYRAIMADPPWAFEAWGEHDHAKSADRHYSVMGLDAIKMLPVSALADRDCLMWMWATQAMIPHALEVLDAWGFSFVTQGAWAKASKTGKAIHMGTGYVLRSSAEFYIIGRRGNLRTASRSVRNLIVAPVREHSRKPDEARDDLEAMVPGGPFCELFARETKPGWDTWGNERTKFGGEEVTSVVDKLARLGHAFERRRLAGDRRRD